jgi:hypothetical protein
LRRGKGVIEIEVEGDGVLVTVGDHLGKGWKWLFVAAHNCDI